LEAHVRELLDLLIRWVHLIAGIMWVGNSMLFNWLDRNLIKVPGKGEGHEGEIWMVHSGGFYQVEKKQLAPGEMPAVLHWFKWQNGITWMSGILLLSVVYYLGGGGLLVDPAVADISPGAAMGIGIGAVIASWVVYDVIWRSPLGKKGSLATALSFAVLAGVTVALSQYLSGRAAFIHTGVVMGTVMTGNVWMVIVPSQRELIAATNEGRKQDQNLAYRAKQRSIHNNYLTFPLLFIMVSNHYPSTYANKLNWLVLLVLMIAGAGVRHFMNIRFTLGSRWIPAAGSIAALGIIALYMLTMPRGSTARVPEGPPVAFAEAQAIVAARCIACHSASPTDDVWKAAPGGVMFDTPTQIKLMAPRIKERVWVTRTMPFNNKTNITDSERDTLARWVQQGAKM
jgi:uncharacterized membrane protein